MENNFKNFSLMAARITDTKLPTSSQALKYINYISKILDKRVFDPTLKKEHGKTIAGNSIEMKDSLKLSFKDLIELMDKTNEQDMAVNFKQMIDSGTGSKKSDTALYQVTYEMVYNSRLSGNTRRILQSHAPIFNFLFCKAKYYSDYDSAEAIFSYMTNEKDGGIKEVIDYIQDKSLQNIIEKNNLNVEPATKQKISDKIKKGAISLEPNVFEEAINKYISGVLDNSNELAIIAGVKDQLNIMDYEEPALIKYIKAVNAEKPIINAGNAATYLWGTLSEIRYQSLITSGMPVPPAIDGTDYTIQYYLDEQMISDINKENVYKAAELYYCMFVGEEIGVFNVIEKIRDRLNRNERTGRIDITSIETLNNLQAYFFDGTFKGKNGSTHKRTTDEERLQAYAQIFGVGDEKKYNTYINTEFQQLWENLLLEGNEYIGKISTSQNPELYVSKQGIIQGIEDLQRNLSDSCVGFSKLLAPVIHEQLDFVINKFLLDKEISNQVAPNRGLSGLIQDVLFEAGEQTNNVSNMLQIAAYSHMILKDVAEFTPEFINIPENFTRLINNMNALWSKLNNLRKREEMYSRRDEVQNDNQTNRGDIRELQEVSKVNGTDDWNF